MAIDQPDPSMSEAEAEAGIVAHMNEAMDRVRRGENKVLRADGDERLVELDVTDYPPTRHTIILGRMANSTPSRAGRQAGPRIWPLGGRPAEAAPVHRRR